MHACTHLGAPTQPATRLCWLAGCWHARYCRQHAHTLLRGPSSLGCRCDKPPHHPVLHAHSHTPHPHSHNAPTTGSSGTCSSAVGPSRRAPQRPTEGQGPPCWCHPPPSPAACRRCCRAQRRWWTPAFRPRCRSASGSARRWRRCCRWVGGRAGGCKPPGVCVCVCCACVCGLGGGGQRPQSRCQAASTLCSAPHRHPSGHGATRSTSPSNA